MKEIDWKLTIFVEDGHSTEDGGQAIAAANDQHRAGQIEEVYPHDR